MPPFFAQIILEVAIYLLKKESGLSLKEIGQRKGVSLGGRTPCSPHPGKLNLIATGFCEGATAVNFARTFLNPGERAEPGHSSNLKW